MTMRLIPAATAVAALVLAGCSSAHGGSPLPGRPTDTMPGRRSRHTRQSRGRPGPPTITLCDGLGRGYTVTGGPLTTPAAPGR